MKKIILCLSMFLMFSIPAIAIDFVCEPEDNNAVSYGVFSYAATGLECTFVKYAPENSKDEYWIRLAEINPRDKLLNNIVLTIDGQSYPLTAISPDEKYANAAFTVQRTYGNGMFFSGGSPMRTNIRYFVLSPEIIQKLQLAKKVTITYSSFKIINQLATLEPNYLTEIQHAYSLKFSQYPEYWKPRDESK